ncbi:MAG: YfiR family protein [Methylococcales bacterium]|nr:YfiR family protein [Methylococcales bacterium]
MKKTGFHKKSRLFLLISSLTALLFLSAQPFAQDKSNEYKIKAGYLYNFTKFIYWPDNESATFNLCIVGDDPFGSIINPIEKRTVNNKPIRLHRFQTITKKTHCHLIYFSGQAEKLIKKDNSFPTNSSAPSLTVGESDQFIKANGMISFFLSAGKVKLRINLASLKKSGLTVSAKLLEVSDIYEGKSND